MINIEAPISPNHKKGFYVTIYYMHGDADAYTEDEIYFEDSHLGAIAAERFYRMVKNYIGIRPEEGNNDEYAFWNSAEPPIEYCKYALVKDIIMNMEFYFSGDCTTCDGMYNARVDGVHMTYWDGANWCNCTVDGEDWWKPEENEVDKDE